MMTKSPNIWRVIACLTATASLYVGVANLAQAGTIPPGQSPGGSIAPGSSSNQNGTDSSTPGTDSSNSTGGTDSGNANPSTDASVDKPKTEESPERLVLSTQDVQIVVEALPGDVTLPGAQVGDLVQSKVTSSFTLKNNEDGDESTIVRLPLSDLSGLKDGRGQLMEASDYTVMVNGEVVSPTVVEETNPLGGSEPPVKWVEFPITVTAGSSVEISSTYSASAAGALPLAQFNYALETAGGWNGRVGQSKVTLALPYEASKQNVFSGENESTSGGRITGNTVVWSRKNFEPSAKDNIKMTLLAPQVWTNIENARSAVKQAPGDVEALLALARAYKGAIFLDNGVAQGSTAQFVPLAEDSYKKALKVAPNSAELHAEYAQFMMDTQVAEALNTRKALPLLGSILDQAEAALKIDPKNQSALGMLATLKSLATDAAERTPSTAANKLVARIDAVAQSVGTENVVAAATAVAASNTLTEATGMADPSQGITGTTEMTATTGAVDSGAGVSGTAAMTNTTGVTGTGSTSVTVVGGQAGRTGGLPQMLLTVVCIGLVLLGIIAAVLILVFRRWNRSTSQDSTKTGQ